MNESTDKENMTNEDEVASSEELADSSVQELSLIHISEPTRRP